MSDQGINLPDFARNAVNLASSRLGAQVIYATDDFFAPKERLIKNEVPVFIADKYDDHGKWMDGWESRRRRDGGNDHCILRLGARGTITGVDIDTRHFTGNHPPEASIEGALSESDPGDNTQWAEIVPRTKITANAQNFIAVDNSEKVNILRLNIFPDGGVARLRVYGEPHCEWKRHEPNGVHELTAITNGGGIVGYNDAHYGNPWVILAPGRGLDMGDGWETRRRREPGNDWIVVALGAPGIVERIEVDTAHFKGNYPDRCSVQAALVDPSSDVDLLTDDCSWADLVSLQKLEMDKIHTFEDDVVNKLGPISHARLNIFPDGGVSRFRLFGKLATSDG